MPFLGSKPVLEGRCCDETTEKRAPLPWVIAQDQPRRGAKDNEKGALGAELSSLHTHKSTEIITTTSRHLNVICTHLGGKNDTRSSPYQATNTTIHNVSDRIHHTEATTERPGLAPSAACLRKSVLLTLDAARRMGSPQSYRASGRIRPM